MYNDSQVNKHIAIHVCTQYTMIALVNVTLDMEHGVLDVMM